MPDPDVSAIDRDQLARAQSAKRKRPEPQANLPDGIFTKERLVRFSFCDPAGIVYTPKYVDLVNGVIEDFFLEALKIDYHRTISIDRIGLGYAKVDCDFFLPAIMGDLLSFAVCVGRIGRASTQIVVHGYRGKEAVMRAALVLVTTSLETYKAIAIPDRIRQALVGYSRKF